MTIVTNEHQRRFWRVKATHIIRRLDDLRLELDVAMQQRLSIPVLATLAEVDDDLAAASAAISLASAKIDTLP